MSVFSGHRIKTPILIQMEAAECGAAALGAVLSHFGCHLPLEELREKCGVSRDGCDAFNMVRAARHYGLEAEGYQASLDELRAQAMPVILFWEYNHFVVLEHLGRRGAWLNDPATGRRRVTLEELDASYSGVALLMSRAAAFRPQGRPPTWWWALPARLRPIRKPLVFLLVVQFALAVLVLLASAFPRVFLDEVWSGKLRAAWFLPAMTGFSLLMLGVTITEVRVLNRLTAKLSICLSAEFLWHGLRLPIKFFSQRFGGEVVNRIDLNVSITDTLSREVIAVVPNLVFVLIYLVALWHYDTLISLIGLAAAAVDLAVFSWVSQARQNAYARLQQDEAKAAGMVIDTLQHMETVKATGTDQFFFARLLGQLTRNINTHQGIGRRDLLLVSGSWFIQGLSSAALLGVGAWRVIEGELTVGMLFALQFLLSRFLSPISELVGSAARLQEFKVDLQRLEDVTKNRLDPVFFESSRESGDSKKDGDGRLLGGLEFRDICFGYSPLDKPLVEDLCWRMAPGEHVAMVGATGSGKSTVARLATGLVEPWSGELLYDGCPRARLSREAMIGSLASVDQQVFLFSGTIRENLSLWNESISEEAMFQAARDACLHGDILRLPRGYESRLLEDGRNLSAGQRQRLEIARALVTNPSLLILDEATSALDSQTEAQVIENLRQRSCSCLMIAHRLSSIQHCDQILVLDGGRLVQRGTHGTLKAAEGLYREFIRAEGGRHG